ncbi:MAG TPA: acyltransferase [Cytophagaceae bacterium]
MKSLNLFIGSLLNYIYNDVITHIPIHFFRINFLRVFNRKIHPTVKILLHTKLLNFWKVEISERVVINQYCLLDCRHHIIKIGSDTDIGPYTKIWTLGHNPDDNEHAVMGGDVYISDHVWIASGVTILPKIMISKGAVVASGSVVTKNVGILEVVGGNPAKFLKTRNNELKYYLNFTPLFN